MHRILLAFRCYFAVLFKGALSDELVRELKLSRAAARPQAAAPPAQQLRPTDGALQILAILQRDSRLIDFLMEDIGPYSDDQVGAAVRALHDQARDALSRYVTLQPVIDGVEGAYTKAPAADGGTVKFIGNVPAQAPQGGVLRHKGWRAAKIDLPSSPGKQDLAVIAPAEIEVE